MCQAAAGYKLRYFMSSHIITYYMCYVLLHNAGYMMQMIVSSIWVWYIPDLIAYI